MAMIVEGEVSVNASAEEVWGTLSDVEHWNEWTPSIKSILLLDPKPLHLGSTALIEQPRLPRAKWQVTKIEPGRGFDWVSKNIGSLTIGSTGSRLILKAELRSFYESCRLVGWQRFSGRGSRS